MRRTIALAMLACTAPNDAADLPECYEPAYECVGQCIVQSDYAGDVLLRVRIEDDIDVRVFRDSRRFYPDTGRLLERQSDVGLLRCWPNGGIAERYDTDPHTGDDSAPECWAADGSPTPCPPLRWEQTAAAALLPYEYTHTEVTSWQ